MQVLFSLLSCGISQVLAELFRYCSEVAVDWLSGIEAGYFVSAVFLLCAAVEELIMDSQLLN